MFKQGVCANFRKENVFFDAKKAGADYVELAYCELANATDDEIAALAQQLKELDLPCLGYNCMFPWSGMKVTGKTRDFVAIDEYLHRQVERLSILDSRYVVFGSHGARKLDGDNAIENATEELVELLSDHVAPIFRKAGLICAIEPLSVDDLVHTVADGARLAEKVNLPEIRLLADTFHMYRNGETYEDILPHGHLLSHVHVGEGAERYYPKTGDGMHYERLFEVLRQVQYSGVVSVEADLKGKDFYMETKEAMDALRLAQQ